MDCHQLGQAGSQENKHKVQETHPSIMTTPPPPLPNDWLPTSGHWAEDRWPGRAWLSEPQNVSSSSWSCWPKWMQYCWPLPWLAPPGYPSRFGLEGHPLKSLGKNPMYHLVPRPPSSQKAKHQNIQGVLSQRMSRKNPHSPMSRLGQRKSTKISKLTCFEERYPLKSPGRTQSLI